MSDPIVAEIRNIRRKLDDKLQTRAERLFHIQAIQEPLKDRLVFFKPRRLRRHKAA